LKGLKNCFGKNMNHGKRENENKQKDLENNCINMVFYQGA